MMSLPTNIKSESKFIQFLFNFMTSIRSKQWESRDFADSGAHCLSMKISEVLKSAKASIKDWSDDIEIILDHFLEHSQDYSPAEFDVIVR